MIVIGIDPAKYGFHAAVLRTDAFGEEHLSLTSLSAEQKDYQLPSMVISKVHMFAVRLLYPLVQAWPDEDIAVFCEEPVSAGARNLRTYGQLAMSVGAILSGTTLYTPKCYLVPVSKWKMVTVGSGNASKEQVALWLNRVHPSYALDCAGSQDLIDACCIARYGLSVMADSLLLSAPLDSVGEV